MRRTSSCRAGLLLAAGALVAASLAAPALAAPPADETMLHLSARGSVQAAPDLLVAHLVAEASGADAAVAQRQVNQQISTATGEAARAAGVSWSLQDYGMDRSDDKLRTWTARQTLVLRSGEAAGLLDLVGRLQARGLALADLAWSLSPARQAEAQARASDLALRALKTRAAAAAASLGMKLGAIRDVRLQDGVMPRPLMRAMVAAAPQATQDEQEGVQEAAGDIALLP